MFFKGQTERLANGLDTNKWKHTLDVKEAVSERSKAPNPEVTEIQLAKSAEGAELERMNQIVGALSVSAAGIKSVLGD